MQAAPRIKTIRGHKSPRWEPELLLQMIESPRMTCAVKDVVLGPLIPFTAITPDAVCKVTTGCKVYAGKKKPPVRPLQCMRVHNSE